MRHWATRASGPNPVAKKSRSHPSLQTDPLKTKNKKDEEKSYLNTASASRDGKKKSSRWRRGRVCLPTATHEAVRQGKERKGKARQDKATQRTARPATHATIEVHHIFSEAHNLLRS